MNLLDENVPKKECEILRRGRIRFQKIGEGEGRTSMTAEDIIPHLHQLRAVTFFTLDVDYYHRRLCHEPYCLVFLDVDDEYTASTIRRFLRHRQFRTWAQRKGKVIRITPSGMHVWQLGAR